MDIDTLKQALGEAIRAHRKSLGLSQDSFAALIGVHRTYLGGIERGERNLSLANLARIADGLGVSISKLFLDAEKVLTTGTNN